jgi:hypothetical protein
MLLLGLGNEDTLNSKSLARTRGGTYHPPESPSLPELNQGPAFVVTSGTPTSDNAAEAISGLHELYRAQEPKLRAAKEGRERAAAAEIERLRLNPPKPQDVDVFYFRGR